MKKILIISYSHLHKDPRIIRQIQALEKDYNIETIGHSAYNKSVKHHNVEVLLPNIQSKFIRKILSFLHTHRTLDSFLLKKRLGELHHLSDHYDLIICNDLYPLPLAAYLAEKYNCKLWSDLHEFYPSQIANSMFKKWEYQSFIIYLCKTYIPKADIRISVCQCVADKYKKKLSIDLEEIITNATAYNKINNPTPPSDKIKLVHHGVAAPIRKMELMLDVIKLLPDTFELHLYLVAHKKELKDYLARLKAYARGWPIFFHEAVSTQEIPTEINQYDIGLFILPPLTDNYYCALPNKLFEFIQARLAIAVSPNPEMAKIVSDYELGIVSQNYTAKTMADSLRSLSVMQIKQHKNNTHKIAKTLSAETNLDKMRQITKQLLSG